MWNLFLVLSAILMLGTVLKQSLCLNSNRIRVHTYDLFPVDPQDRNNNNVFMNLRPAVSSVIQPLHQQLNKYKKEEFDDNLDSDDFCRTSNCVLSAAKMDSLIDWKANPCDDFYNFACGRFVSDSTLHDRSDSLNAFSVTDNKIKDQLRRLFTRKIESSEIKPFKMAKMMFKSCMNSASTEARGTEPLIRLIDTIGGWPMLGNWDENAWDLEQSIMLLRKHQGHDTQNIFRDEKLFRSYRDTSSAYSSTNQTHKSNEKQNGNEHLFLRSLRSFSIDIAILLGADRQTVEMQIDDAIHFQKELIKLNSWLTTNMINTGAVNGFQREVYVKYLLTQWLDLFHSLPIQFLLTENQNQMDSNTFLNAFEKLLARTSKQTVANYFVIRVILFSSEFLTNEIKERSLHYKMELFGVKQKKESWKRCVDIVTNILEQAVEVMFTKEYFDLESKDEAIEIATKLKSSYIQTLNSIEWMSLEAKSKALLKVESIIARLRFPKELLDPKALEVSSRILYKKVSIQQENYFESVLNLTIFNADRNFQILKTGIDTGSGSLGLLNSVDVKDFNKIRMTLQVLFYEAKLMDLKMFSVFPAGVLQREVLSPDRPKYLNYATSGFILGYIFSQAFESFQPTHNSFPRNVIDKINCFILQYDNYTDTETGLKTKGKQTLDGNIADITSLNIVYSSYKKWVSENGNELRLPALKFTTAQFFWIAYAQLFCTVSRPEKRKNLNDFNPHPTEKFRVIGPLSNSEEFSQAFNCPVNSPMNPPSKCSLF